MAPEPPAIKSISEFLKELDQIGFITARHSHVRVWFRGQPQFGLPLQPKVYRKEFPAHDEDQKLELDAI